MTAISLTSWALATYLAALIPSILCHGNSGLQRYGMVAVLVAGGGLGIVGGFQGLTASPAVLSLPIGLPWLPMHLRLDPLGGFFTIVIGLMVVSTAVYSAGYLRDIASKRSLTPLAIALSVFIAAMQGVVLSDDAYTFMIFWEIMSLSSYFLVTFEHENEGNRKAGFLYLLMAHLGGLLILGSYAVMFSAADSLEFSAMRAATLDPTWASLTFILAGLGFGMKAGVIPLHVWLPEAHPVAPSNASALMSGVMIKVAIFGFIRVVWDLIGIDQIASWWWGGILLTVGSSSAVGGVLLALQQHDLKRLLAYHSVENIGIIVIGLGLSLVFNYYDHNALAALGLIAALYHTINHALFKGLLFMGAGAVLHATGTRNMEKMGGLIKRMPRTAFLFLIACISISALPPFNGFVSEWLTFQAALMAPQIQGTLLSALIPFTAAMLALAGALAAACFVKVFGVVFQGQARSSEAEKAHEVDGWMQAGMLIPAIFCFLLGIGPTIVLPLLDTIPASLTGSGLPVITGDKGMDWLWFSPLNPERATYSPLIVMIALIVAGLSAWAIRRHRLSIRHSVLWSCGHPKLTARMQYTATGFSQPLRQIFSGIYRPQSKTAISDHGHTLLSKQLRHVVHVQDLSWQFLYLPIRGLTERLTRWVEKQQHHSIHIHLAWPYITLIIMLGVLGI